MTVTLDEFRQAGAIVTSWRRPLLVSHTRPDGDALGSLVAMRSILRSAGAQPMAVLFDAVPPNYRFLIERDPLLILGTQLQRTDLDRADGILLLDTCTYSQLEPVAEWLRGATCPKVVVDHHVTRDPIADVYVVDEASSATCAILYEWTRACRQELDSIALRALFVGIATDTGWFRFSNCDARALEIAADLVRRGVVPEHLYKPLFECESAARLRLFGAALGAMELSNDHRVAVIPLSKAIFEATGTTSADTENLINEPMKVESVQVAVLLAESGDGFIKASFRSKGEIDVAALAAEFGGGGHVRAAGARIRGSLDDVKRMVRARLIP